MWIRPDAMMAFEVREIKEALPRYIEVVKGSKKPLFRISQQIFVSVKDDPWEAHKEGMEVLRECLDDCEHLGRREEISLFDLKLELIRDITTSCHLCEWRCGVNRLKGEIGVCKVSKPRVSSAFIHMGEEPPITPSGTIFFSGCNFRCVFCQNWDISQNPDAGWEVSPEGLANIMDDLRSRGARNINLVGGEPTPNLFLIVEALKHVRTDFPIVWNSNMYMSREVTELLLGLVDLWLPDFKYWEDEHARIYSGVPKYREVVTRNLKLAYTLGEMVIRHLVLPNHVECCTVPILRWIAQNVPNALVNVMEQYRPEYKAYKYREINRRPTGDEMRRAYEEAERLGLRWKSVSLF